MRRAGASENLCVAGASDVRPFFQTTIRHKSLPDSVALFDLASDMASLWQEQRDGSNLGFESYDQHRRVPRRQLRDCSKPPDPTLLVCDVAFLVMHLRALQPLQGLRFDFDQPSLAAILAK